MKLAYVNEIPKQDQLAEFIQTYTKECMKSGVQYAADLHIHSPHYVISVYDENELVGFGSMEDSMNIHVRPAYRHREVENMVLKLLQAESKFCPVQGK